jgi:enamine deaminase RidA (YjgF/YER057c/UK114 family)
MGSIERISGNAPWEPIAGYSRAVKAGQWVLVSGTTATDQRGALVGPGQMYIQARQAIANVGAALGRAGLSLRDVVRTRMFVTDVGRFAEAARAHREAFGAAPPATTMVEVSGLVHPDMLFEIEAVAYAGGASAAGSTPAARSRQAVARKPTPKAGKKPRAAKKPSRGARRR